MDASLYPPAVRDLLAEDRLPALGPGTPNAEARLRLEALRVETAFAPQPVRDPDMARCCIAGLWLFHDYLDEAHQISQEIATPSGSYWHGLMHRREPDYSNSKYWFRRVGRHPIFEPLQREAGELAAAFSFDEQARKVATQAEWDPFLFIDLCERSAGGQGRCEPLCLQIQQREWALLFGFCFGRALGRVQHQPEA